MNSLEILYQVYRARYSLNRVQDRLDKDYRLGLLGFEGWPDRLAAYLGEERSSPRVVEVVSINGVETEPTPLPETSPLLRLGLPVEPESRDDLAGVDAALIHLGTSLPAPEVVRDLAESIPVKVRCLWMVESLDLPAAFREDQDPTLPRIYRIDPVDPGPVICGLFMRAFPELSLAVARDYAQLRFHYARRLVRRHATRNGMLAAASSVRAPTVPALKFLWSFLATTGETLAITASQLRLCLMMAALHARPMDFFDRVGELWPIIGSAFGWRTVARELIGVVPVGGWALKAAIAYSGTWMVGEGSRLFYEYGQPTESEVLREIKRRSQREAFKALERHLMGSLAQSPDTPAEAEPVEEDYDPVDAETDPAE